jgi:hypothetical protein
LLLLLPEQIDHLGDPSSPLVRASLRGVDPTQERLPIELRQPIEERSRSRFGIQRSPNIVGKILTLRSLRREHDSDNVARSDTTISPPRRPEHDPEPITKRFD